MNLLASVTLSLAIKVQISSMSLWALRLTLTSNYVGMLELPQELPHFTFAPRCDILFPSGQKFCQVACFQVLLICSSAKKDGVRLAVLREDDGPTGFVDMVQNLLCIPLQIS